MSTGMYVERTRFLYGVRFLSFRFRPDHIIYGVSEVPIMVWFGQLISILPIPKNNQLPKISQIVLFIFRIQGEWIQGEQIVLFIFRIQMAHIFIFFSGWVCLRGFRLGYSPYWPGQPAIAPDE